MAITGADFEDGTLTGTVSIVGGKAVILKEIVGGLTVDKRLKVELRSDNPTGNLIATTNTINILKGNSNTPYYAVFPNKSVVAEGEEIVFTVLTSNVADGVILFWSMEGVSSNGRVALNNNDFVDGVGSGQIVINDNRNELVKVLSIDGTTESIESFKILIRTGSISGTTVAESIVVNVSNVNGNSPSVLTYSVTPSSTSIVEGGSVTFNVVTTNVNSGTVINWVIEDMTSSIGSGEIKANDFLDNTLEGTVTITNGRGSIVRQLKADTLSEGDEAFKLVLKGTDLGTLASSAVVRVIDVSTTITPSTAIYLISPDKSSVLEGQTVTFSVVTTEVGDGTVLYWDTQSLGGNVQANDFGDGLMMGTVTITNNQGVIVREITDDLTGDEVGSVDRFKLRLRVDSHTGLVVASSPEVTIIDKPPAVSPPPIVGTTNKRLGTNLVDLKIVNPLRNLIKGAKPFTSLYNSSQITVNQYGYPISSGTYTTEFPVYQSGRYVLSWEGSGSATVSDISNRVSFLYQTSTPGGEYEVTLPNDGLTGYYRYMVRLTITGVVSSDPMRNLFFCRKEDFNALYQSRNTGNVANQFLPELIDDLSLYYSVLRVNELMGANQSGYDDDEQQVLGVWGKRQQVLDMTYDREVPIELIIQLCNETKCSPWLSIHLLANAQYAESLAEYVKQHLDPTLYVYIEYSSELWNEDQPQYQQFNDIISVPSVLPDNIGVASPEYKDYHNYCMTTKAGELFRVFKTSFYNDPAILDSETGLMTNTALSSLTRVVGVMALRPGGYRYHLDGIINYATDGEKTGKEPEVLNWFKTLGIDAISTIGYFMYRHPVVWMPEGITLDPEETANNILQALLTNKPGIINLQEALAIITRDKEAATPYGLRTLIYEGGHHLLGKGNGAFLNSVTQATLILFKKPQFKEIVRKHINDCLGVVNDVFCHYCWRSKYSGFSLFGLREGLSTVPTLLEEAIQQVAQTLPSK